LRRWNAFGTRLRRESKQEVSRFVSGRFFWLDDCNGIRYNAFMIKSFADKETARFWDNGHSRRIPFMVKERARDKLQMLHASEAVENLRFPPSNNLEKLSGDRKGFWSIRINKQYRIVFRFVGGDAHDVEIVDYH